MERVRTQIDSEVEKIHLAQSYVVHELRLQTNVATKSRNLTQFGPWLVILFCDNAHFGKSEAGNQHWHFYISGCR